ncbi:MAG: acetoacetate--CoA ligase [Candidatus Rariloculaceae bacterium]
MTEPMWRPSPQRIAASNMQEFLERHRGELDSADYTGLYRWSIEKPDEFWSAAWRYLGIRSTTDFSSVLDDPQRMPGAEWFNGARLNYADNLLRPEYEGTAIIAYAENGRRVELGWDELRQQVASVSAALRSFGVKKNDRVAGLLPNCPEAIVAMLATASIGAIWSSCSPDFGAAGVLDRFGQIEPKVLFAADGYSYNGKPIDSRPLVGRISRELPNLSALIVVPYMEDEPDFSEFPDATLFGELSTDNAPLVFEPLPFSHPLFIMYSSGTTGNPKCIVHSAGASLIQHQKEHVLHTDVKPGDVVFYFTTCGWMMWNWLVSGLASGATLLLFDGSPFHPGPEVLWQIAEREKVTVFGTSAKYLSALEKAGYRPRERVNLDHLKSVLSTGSPLAPTSFDFVYEDIKQDLQLSSVAGGTDIIACFGAGNPLLPVYRGELQCRALGMKAEIYNSDGYPVRREKGELVCTAAFPSMPLAFWNDEDGSKYHAAYFSRFPGVWSQGDYAELTENDGIIIYGRSDAVLNPGGVRIGTAEIYRVVEQFDEIAESIVVGQDWEDDVRIVLFVRLQPGHIFDENLRNRLRDSVRANASPKHVPAKILEVADIPRTINGKIVELAVRDVLHGREVSNTDALANPTALNYFRDRQELAES